MEDCVVLLGLHVQSPGDDWILPLLSQEELGKLSKLIAETR